MLRFLRNLTGAARRWASATLTAAVLRAKGIEVGANLTTLGGGMLTRRGNGKFRLGAGVTLGRGVRIEVFDGGALTIEDGVLINDFCRILCGGTMKIEKNAQLTDGVIIYCNGEVSLGESSLLAAYVVIADTDHVMTNRDKPIKDQGNTPPRPVRIGAGVWLGSKATVTKGVTIGTGAVIGANAVVTRDIPAYAVAVGIPARVVHMRPDDAPANQTL